jgi:hypothetical protein
LIDITKDDIAATAELCRRAILTVTALPDRERKWLRTQVVNLEVRQSIDDAYGYTEERRPRFRPTARDIDNMLPVMGWLSELRASPHPGPRDYRIIWARAFGCPWWRLAGQLGRSDRQVQRYYDAAIEMLTRKHQLQDVVL